LKNRVFRVVFVRQNHGIADGVTDQADRVVNYSGTSVFVK